MLDRCVPDVQKYVKIALAHFEDIHWLEFAFHDVVLSWKQILGMCLFSVGRCFSFLIWMFLRMKCHWCLGHYCPTNGLLNQLLPKIYIGNIFC